ncbi:MAG: hypothetical protein RJB57_759, partial [Actinomycetota bacterium]
MGTDLLFLRDAYLQSCDAVVTEVRHGDDGRTGVVLDR